MFVPSLDYSFVFVQLDIITVCQPQCSALFSVCVTHQAVHSQDHVVQDIVHSRPSLQSGVVRGTGQGHGGLTPVTRTLLSLDRGTSGH